MTIRICPERDGACPHGLECPFAIDRYHCLRAEVPASSKVADALPLADADGWIKHTPGPCPVPPETIVETRFRDGKGFMYRARHFGWGDRENPITHYRIVTPAPSPSPVREVVEVRKEIVPGTYGVIRLCGKGTTNQNGDYIVSIEVMQGVCTAAELLAASDTLRQIAEAMKEQQP